MIGKVFLLALLVAIASASPLALDSTTSDNYGVTISQFLAAWKQMIPCGYAAGNIPVMSPLTNDFTAFNFSRGETNLVGNVSNIRISGLDDFIILSGSFNTTTQKAKFDVLFPEIQILGSYALQGMMSLLGFAFPVRDVSLINERFQQLRFVGEYTFGQSLTNSSGLRISEYHLQFYLADVKIDNWDLLLNIAANDYANSWSSQIIDLAVKLVQKYVDELLAIDVIPSVNDLLANVSMAELSQFLINTAANWNSVDCQVQA
ncbi:uncharacterized protein LOC132785141 [Drosophila nasuta]|uniref:uncharacterized protein LOC132785141 n=1 Tax=Drosophila nasuta TaxID=42062 RepID=UPI00295F1BE2|nr:uncharacterized protein LOC132785141 [Drosophila nasuta]